MSAIARNDAGSAVERLAGTWKIDPAHSGIEFVVTHLMISKVRGRFSDIAGTVVTDGTPEGSRVEAEIGAASITTNDVGPRHASSIGGFL
jgi:polyisoprenoid-binding protein YceI